MGQEGWIWGVENAGLLLCLYDTLGFEMVLGGGVVVQRFESLKFCTRLFYFLLINGVFWG